MPVKKVKKVKVKKVNGEFILKELIPFILREHGQGFSMQQWAFKARPGREMLWDGVWHTIPPCGTVACIGGSARILMKEKGIQDMYTREYLGLTASQYEHLVYGWMDVHQWGEPYVSSYAKAGTPLAKAKVAVRLLKKVVATDGKVLGTL
jgi:hypothetical protein